ncbi:MAG: hypothetical protein EZS28_049210 [Streblomastix strix]|uniref:Uncharacterized protein n=1 Tax=Streblomastix strix TaxID=222440 RepID=A0A5J4TBS5_9EUKA|nr:MAG: hypothetical protein EZS28_049210 [Streblomastix strix]
MIEAVKESEEDQQAAKLEEANIAGDQIFLQSAVDNSSDLIDQEFHDPAQTQDVPLKSQSQINTPLKQTGSGSSSTTYMSQSSQLGQSSATNVQTMLRQRRESLRTRAWGGLLNLTSLPKIRGSFVQVYTIYQKRTIVIFR